MDSAEALFASERGALMAERLFGTDGIRAVAGRGVLAAENIGRLGRAIAAAIEACGLAAPGEAKALIARDSRPSGEPIARELALGLVSAGVAPEDAGVLPTPGVSFLVRRSGFTVGIAVSASHNPAEYNGIKVFGPDGTKASDELEAAIEAAYARESSGARAGVDRAVAAAARLRVSSCPLGALASRAYVDVLVGLGGAGGLEGRRVVLDCANGATGATAREAFQRLGADVILLNGEMDGARINERCGALHPEVVAAAVRERGASAGFSFDGDGDRVIAVDERGAIHDGDDILFALAGFLLEKGELAGRTVVATVLSNMGLELALRRIGVRLDRVPVGDRHVSRRLLEGGFALGGEQSGHVILPNAVGPTGDGIACAIEILRAAAALDRPLSALLAGFARFPQVARNVRVERKPPFESIPAVAEAIRRAERALEGRGRVLVRYSGTEPIARVMVEGEDAARTQALAEDIARAIDRAINEGGGR
jgi:phosphoglucosamine mutase